MRGSPQRDYVLAEWRSTRRTLLGVVTIDTKVQIPVYLIPEASRDNKDIIGSANTLETVVQVGAGEANRKVR